MDDGGARQGVVIEAARHRALALRDLPQVARLVAAEKVLEMAYQALLTVAFALGVRLRHVDPACDVDAAERGVLARLRARLLEVSAIVRDLGRQLFEGRQRREHEPETQSTCGSDRSFGRTGQEERRIGSLHGPWQELVITGDVNRKVLAFARAAAATQEIEDDLHCLFLHVAPRPEIEPEAVKLIL